MIFCNDPYGIGRLKVKEMEEKNRIQKQDLITAQIANELKSISKRLKELEAKL